MSANYEKSEGAIPANARSIYDLCVKFLTSDYYKKECNKHDSNHQYLDEEYPAKRNELIEFLQNSGFSDDTFRILIRQLCGGYLESPFILGKILRDAGIFPGRTLVTNQDQWQDLEHLLSRF